MALLYIFSAGVVAVQPDSQLLKGHALLLWPVGSLQNQMIQTHGFLSFIIF